MMMAAYMTDDVCMHPGVRCSVHDCWLMRDPLPSSVFPRVSAFACVCVCVLANGWLLM